MKNRLCITFAGMAFTLISSVAVAQNDDFYADGTFNNTTAFQQKPHYKNYISANVGFLKAAVISTELAAITSAYPPAYTASIGRQLSTYMGIEAGYGYATVSTHGVQATFQYPYVTSKFILPVGNRFDLYGKIGVAEISIASKTNPNAATPYEPITFLGLGADINVLPHLALNVDASGPSIGMIGVYAVTGGLALKF